MRHEMSVMIDRPIDDVWAFLSDVFNLPRLRGQTLAIRMTSPGPVGVGSTLLARMSVFGFETQMKGVVTEWEEPRVMTMSVTLRAGAGTIRQTLEPVDGATKVVRVIELDLRPPLRFIWPIFGPITVRRWDKSTRTLKQLLEADGAIGTVAEGKPQD